MKAKYFEANSKDIEWLLENVTQYRISKETGVSQSQLSRLKSGKIDIENITFEVAGKLTKYAKKIKKDEEKR